MPVADSRTLAADAVVPAVASTTSDRIRVYYQVKEGDTLASIAKAFKTTVVSLQSWNRIPSSQIRAGQRLTIYTVRELNAKTQEYKAHKGRTKKRAPTFGGPFLSSLTPFVSFVPFVFFVPTRSWLSVA